MRQGRKKVVVLSGAGISAESGLSTFRDNGGLWEKYDLNEVATIDAWHRNPKLVLEFYEARRQQVVDSQPNPAHFALAQLEKHFDVSIVTQNIDDLHERAGSTDVLHLHGEITKSRSVASDQTLYPLDGPIELGDLCPDGQQKRPHVVWFGEPVPKMSEAEQIVAQSDILIVVGTSLNVYPAAGLIHSCTNSTECFLVDPGNFDLDSNQFTHLKGSASEKIPFLVDTLIRKHS